MDYLRVLSFLFMVSASCGFWITDLLTRKLKNSCPVFDELPAFLQGQKPNHQGFERVVVFVYRAVGTNQLITFIPASQHQKCIPNYPETTGDKVFNSNTITIENLLQSNFNIPIPITKDNLQLNIPEVPVVSNAWNKILFDTVPIENNQRNVNVNIPVPVKPGIPGITTDIKLQDGLMNGLMNGLINGPAEYWNKINPINGNSYPLQIKPEQWSYQQQVTNSEILNQVPNEKQIVPTGPIIPKDVSVDGKIIFPADGHQSIQITPTYHSHQQIAGHVDPLHEKYAIPPGLLENMNIPRPSHGEGYLVPPNSWSSVVSQPFPNYQPPSNLLSQCNPVTNQLNAYSWSINSKFNQMTNQKGPLQKGNLQFTITGAQNLEPSSYGREFDSWLMTELKVIKSSRQGMSSSATDVGFVRRKIEEALRYHGYTVTKNGLLVDEKGMASSLSNLKLRPLLIGNSFEYNNLLNKVQDGTFKRPVTPMIEGILLSLINPPRILGILTLGLTWAGTESNSRVPELATFLSGKDKVENASMLRKLMQNIMGGIRGLKLGGGSNNGTGPPMHIAPDILNRIIGGSSATGTGTLLVSKGRK